jgi:cystathionine beta-lyase
MIARSGTVYDFDSVIDRRRSDSSKWLLYGEDVLPFWTADMDFRSPEPVIEALHTRVAHGVFGYCAEPLELRELIAERMQRLYGWDVSPEWIVFQPGVILGFTRACRANASPGDGVLVQTPVFGPILEAPVTNQQVLNEAELVQSADGSYEIDFEAFERAITARTRVFILCNPHNPVGRVFCLQELQRMAEICLRNDVLICSDEIHCDLVFPGNRHVPIASLGPEVEQRTVTLISPSKTFNLPGLRCSMAIIPDPALRNRLQRSASAHFPEVNTLGFVAALAAYRECQDWLDQLLRYLEANRDLVVDFVRSSLPGIEVSRPEALYLAWLDCRQASIPGNAASFFLEEARVALTDGATFGMAGEGFVRINFACPRSRLLEALRRMKTALTSIAAVP